MARGALISRLSKIRAERRAHKRVSLLLARAQEATIQEGHFAGLSDTRLDMAVLETLGAWSDTTGDGLAAEAPTSFAILREVATRTVGLRPYPVQLAAGFALLEGNLAQMDTGEGKTLAAVIPAALMACLHGGCHVLTFNDYLAHRDAEWMRPFYQRLGLSVGVVQASSSPAERRAAYAADVTYATAKQAGFDFLRDGLVFEPNARVQGPLGAAIIDEADSILIDEARIPLVIAGDREHSGIEPKRIAEIVSELRQGHDFTTENDAVSVNLTEAGLERVEKTLGNVDLHAAESFLLLTEVNQALYAHKMLTRDVDYLVREDAIELVDQLTGRVVSDRRWPDGLQAAVEAKEGLKIRPGGRVLSSITFVHLLERYAASAGMTATAMPAAEEFEVGYGMAVVPIPPNRPCIREDLPDRIFATRRAKERALAAEIARLQAKGRPVLIGTASVAESERLSSLLQEKGVPSRVLNARDDSQEAAIIADAGAPGGVTVSTNMAGRGTDIRLGGAGESERDRVVRLGGLHVIGTNRHESSRIDDQLRGRAGRQGDPGSSEFFVSLEDPIMVANRIDELLPASAVDRSRRSALDHPLVRREVERIQRIASGRNQEIRGTTAGYTEALEKQHRIVATWRDEVLQGEPVIVPEALTDRPDADHLARLLHLEAIDDAWCDHLGFAADVRDGIHLVRLGGLDPLGEFHKQIAQEFSGFQDDVTQRVIKRAKTFDPNNPPSPGATWTYLINDRLGGELQNLLFGSGNMGFSAMATLATGPLLFLWTLREHRRRRMTQP